MANEYYTDRDDPLNTIWEYIPVADDDTVLCDFSHTTLPEAQTNAMAERIVAALNCVGDVPTEVANSIDLERTLALLTSMAAIVAAVRQKEYDVAHYLIAVYDETTKQNEATV